MSSRTAGSPAPRCTVTEEDVATHLAHLLSQHLDLDHDLIDPDVPLSAYGIDSMTGTWLTSALSARCGVPIDRALLVHRPSVTEVAQDVVAALTAPATS
ncbi:acyl carrier protein [Streptomyces sp. NPDC048111]|uniref:acyl carrier protein n=1 Tax=Streptomyces sp. NPDC048111 TaxID=3365500 RepID=UPI0037181B89